MPVAEMNAVVAAELERIPRGDYPQNLYRMIYQTTRLNGLGSHPEVPPTAEAAHEIALRDVRRDHPDFEPVRLY